MDVEKKIPVIPKKRVLSRKTADQRDLDKWRTRHQATCKKRVSPIWSNLHPEEHPGRDQFMLELGHRGEDEWQVVKEYVTAFHNTKKDQSSLGKRPPASEVDSFLGSVSEADQLFMERLLKSLETDRRRRDDLTALRRASAKFYGEELPQSHLNDLLQARPLRGEENAELPIPASKAEKRLRRKLALCDEAFHLVAEKGLTVRQAALRMGLTYHQAWLMIRDLRTGRLRARLDSGSYTRVGRPKLPVPGLDNFLFATMKRHQGCLRVKDLVAVAKITFPGLKLSVSAARIILRARNVVYRKQAHNPRSRNSLPNKRLRCRYMFLLVRALHHGTRVICIDECGVNFTTNREYVFTHREERWGAHDAPLRAQNLTCLVALSQHGVDQAFYCLEGCDAILFFEFIRRLLTVSSL